MEQLKALLALLQSSGWSGPLLVAVRILIIVVVALVAMRVLRV
jgi:hypothetical protein